MFDRNTLDKSARYVLDEYTPQVRKSVLATFEGAVIRSSTRQPKAGSFPLVSEQDEGSKASRAKKKELSKSNLFALLEKASGTGKDSEPSIGSRRGRTTSRPPSTSRTTPMDAKEKREMIHQKFLEAIRKAAERRKNQNR